MFDKISSSLFIYDTKNAFYARLFFRRDNMFQSAGASKDAYYARNCVEDDRINEVQLNIYYFCC